MPKRLITEINGWRRLPAPAAMHGWMFWECIVCGHRRHWHSPARVGKCAKCKPKPIKLANRRKWPPRPKDLCHCGAPKGVRAAQCKRCADLDKIRAVNEAVARGERLHNRDKEFNPW